MIDAKIAEMEEKRNNQPDEDLPKENERVGLNEVGVFDTDLYSGGKSKFEGYHTTLAVDDAEEDDEMSAPQPKRTQYTAPLALLNDVAQPVVACVSSSPRGLKVLGYHGWADDVTII